MRVRSVVASLLTAFLAAGNFARADALNLKSVTAQQVLSVKVGSFRDFPAAFETLERHCEDADDFCMPQPHMTLGSSAEELYAAVAFEGSPKVSAEVKILELPAATVAIATHRGPYHLLPHSVTRLIAAAQSAGYVPDGKSLLRLLHRNRPQTTAPEDLITEIQLPVAKR